MSNSDETHILNLIRNLLLEEKERERMTSMRTGHSDMPALSEANLISHLSGGPTQSLPSLSELMGSGGHQQSQSTHTTSSVSSASTDSQVIGQPFSRVVGQPNLNFMNISHFDSQSHSIDELLGLSSVTGRSSGAIPPLVPPPLPHSGLMLHNQSRQSSAEDSSEAANQLLYASLVSSNTGPSMSTSLPFLLDSISSPSSSMSSHSVTLMSRFESQIRSIANDIQQTIQLHMNGLQMRKEQLLKQLEHIKQTYSTVLSIAHHPHSQDESSVQALPLPQITFTRPDSALYKAVTTLGFLTTPALAVNCSATGDGVENAMEGEATCFTITTRNCFNEELLIGGEHLDIEILVTDSNSMAGSVTIPHSLLDHNNGKYTVTYTIPRGLKLGQVHVSVSVNGLPIQSSPFVVSIVSQRTRNAWKRIATFGSEGSQVGQFCRPWGVAIVRLPSKDNLSGLDLNVSGASKEYLIAVADRSNNRIQLLKLSLKAQTSAQTTTASPASNNGFGATSAGAHSHNGSGSTNTDAVQLSVVHVFGSGPGTRPGQFDRPAGIAINASLGHIIVADKDNHRVQVFDISGTYLFKFGEKGSRPGQFCYPWDIDSCAQTSQILVSDTRNRRIQLFTPYGQYLWHCGQPLDSPRGVSFLSAERFVISDFNKHRLLIIDKSTSSAKDDITPKYIGFGEGSAWGEFLRPQGVVSSGATQIFCADSRNNRISIWNSATQSFDYLGEEIMNLDRPSGLSVVDNLLVVVDFGNNRIQICQR